MLIEPDDVKLDLSTIAAENLNKIFEGKSYSKLVEQFWYHQSKPSQKNVKSGAVFVLVLKSIKCIYLKWRCDRFG